MYAGNNDVTTPPFSLGRAVVSPAGTFSCAYPTGSSQDDFTGAYAAPGEAIMMVDYGDKYTEAEDHFEIDYGPSEVTVTNKTGATLPVGTHIMLQLARAAEPAPLVVEADGVAGSGIQAAIDKAFAAGGGVVRLRDTTYRCTSLTIRDGVYIEGGGCNTILDFSQKGSFSNTQGVIRTDGGAVSGAVNVTSDVAAGDVAIPVDSISGFAPNDYVMIRSTETAFGEATIGEIAHVQWADNGFVYVKHPLAYAYAVSGHTVELVKVTTVTGGLRNLTIKGAGVNPTGLPSPTYTGTPSEGLSSAQMGDRGVEIKFGLDFIVENVAFTGVENIVLMLFCCIGSRVRNCTIDFDSVNQLFQYGVSIFGACRDTKVQGCTFRNGRHHITTNSNTSTALDYVRGMPVGVVIDGNTSLGSWVYAIDTHQAGSDIVISNNKIAGLVGGIEIRTPHTVVIGNKISLPNASVAGLALAHGIASYFSCKNQLIASNIIKGGSLGIYCSPTTRGSAVKVEGNDISGTQSSPINVNRIDGLYVSGNTCQEPLTATTARIDVTDCTGGNISNNVVPVNSATTVFAIYVRATTAGASSDLNVAGNTVSKLGAGAVTAVVFQDNVQNSTIGFNQTKTCNTAADAGADATNTVLVTGASYQGQITIASGAVTVDNWTTALAVDTEAAAATDDLDTINGGTTGQIIVLWSVSGARVITAKDGAGNLSLAGDFAFTTSAYTLTLVKKGTVWLEASRSAN